MDIKGKSTEIEKTLEKNVNGIYDYIKHDIKNDQEINKVFIEGDEKERESMVNEKFKEHYDIVTDHVKNNVSYDQLVDRYYYDIMNSCFEKANRDMLEELKSNIKNIFGDEEDTD